MSAHDAMMSELKRSLMAEPSVPAPRRPIPAAAAAAAMGLSGKKRDAPEVSARVMAPNKVTKFGTRGMPSMPRTPSGERATGGASSGKHKIAESDTAVSKSSKKPMFAKEKNLAADGHASKRETDEKAMRYARMLREGTNDVPGILAAVDQKGNALIPYKHQRQAVQKSVGRNVNYMLLAHDAGTGKTATFFQILAAMELMVKGGARAVITVPKSTLRQWQSCAKTWLNLANKDVVIVQTNKKEEIKEDMLHRVRVLIITHTLVSNLYKVNWEKKKRGPGQKISEWVLKPGVALHPFWKERWDLMGVDEVCVALFSNPTPCPLIPHHLLRQRVPLPLLQALHAQSRYRLVPRTPPARERHGPHRQRANRRLSQAHCAHRHAGIQQTP